MIYAIAASGVVALAVVLGIVFLGGGGAEAASERGAQDAGCTLQTVTAVTNKSDHSDVPHPETKVKWNTFPPSNGPHYGPTIIYGSYNEPLLRSSCSHNLEHGGVAIQWGSKVPDADGREDPLLVPDDDPNGLVLAPLPALGDKIALTAWRDPTPAPATRATAAAAGSPSARRSTRARSTRSSTRTASRAPSRSRATR